MICPFCKAWEAALPDGSVQCTHCRSRLQSDRHETAQVHPEQRMPTTDRPQRPLCMHLLFSHEGRINRAKYWLGNLLLLIIWAVASAMFEWLHPGLRLLASLLTIYPSIMLYIKRAHDLDRSGHFCWLLLIPLVNIFPAILLGFFKGTTGPNRFGPDPLSPSPIASPEVSFSQAI
jgi:uncharacterized membrane protein YhaH (DUF805 family)